MDNCRLYLILVGCLFLGMASASSIEIECNGIEEPNKYILCYANSSISLPTHVDVCRCSHLVVPLAVNTLSNANITLDEELVAFLKASGSRNDGRLRRVLSLTLSTEDFSAISSVQSITTSVAGMIDDLLIEGVEIHWQHPNIDENSKKDKANLVDFMKELHAVLQEKIIVTSSPSAISDMNRTSEGDMGEIEATRPLILLRLPTAPELLVKAFDLKPLARTVDLFVIATHNMADANNVTYHHSRLMGLSDILNTDSVMDLVASLGVSSDRVVAAVPTFAVQFRLRDVRQNLPGSPVAQDPIRISKEQLCSLLSKGNWTVERDDDLTGTYAYSDEGDWIAFDDEIAAQIKAKYFLLRDVAGVAMMPATMDEKLTYGCNPNVPELSMVQIYYEQFQYQESGERTRRQLATSLQEDVSSVATALSSPMYNERVRASPYRIVRIVSRSGESSVIRQPLESSLQCSRQGYYRHPEDCGRFYRCVKFDQYVDDFTVFEYDCPEGLVFDERYEVCTWPSQAAPCGGSSEIRPVPMNKFVCPGEGYFADPENCRWFFACRDYAKDGSPFTQYEFRCPFGLLFDEQNLICNWPWLVPQCSGAGTVGYIASTSNVDAVKSNQQLEKKQPGAIAIGSPGYLSGKLVTGEGLYKDPRPAPYMEAIVSTGCIDCQSAGLVVRDPSQDSYPGSPKAVQTKLVLAIPAATIADQSNPVRIIVASPASSSQQYPSSTSPQSYVQKYLSTTTAVYDKSYGLSSHGSSGSHESPVLHQTYELSGSSKLSAPSAMSVPYSSGALANGQISGYPRGSTSIITTGTVELQGPSGKGESDIYHSETKSKNNALPSVYSDPSGKHDTPTEVSSSLGPQTQHVNVGYNGGNVKEVPTNSLGKYNKDGLTGASSYQGKDGVLGPNGSPSYSSGQDSESPQGKDGSYAGVHGIGYVGVVNTEGKPSSLDSPTTVGYSQKLFEGSTISYQAAVYKAPTESSQHPEYKEGASVYQAPTKEESLLTHTPVNSQYQAPALAQKRPYSTHQVPVSTERFYGNFDESPASTRKTLDGAYKDPASYYEAPAPVYPPVYNAPAPGYRAPAPVYQAPAYEAPVPVYQTPAPVYQVREPVYQAPAPVHQISAPIYQSPSPDYPSPASSYENSASAYESPASVYKTPAPAYQPPAYQAPASSYKASASVYQAPAPVYEAPSPAFKNPAPVYENPAPVYETPAPVNKAPAPIYKNPAPAYKNPAPTYKASTPVYEAPAPIYTVPAPTYQAPASSYKAPTPAYEAPSSIFENLSPVYKTPAPAYEAPLSVSKYPAPAYEAPAPVYKNPAPIYQAPATVYEGAAPTPQAPSLFHEAPTSVYEASVPGNKAPVHFHEAGTAVKQTSSPVYAAPTTMPPGLAYKAADPSYKPLVSGHKTTATIERVSFPIYEESPVIHKESATVDRVSLPVYKGPTSVYKTPSAGIEISTTLTNGEKVAVNKVTSATYEELAPAYGTDIRSVNGFPAPIYKNPTPVGWNNPNVYGSATITRPSGSAAYDSQPIDVKTENEYISTFTAPYIPADETVDTQGLTYPANSASENHGSGYDRKQISVPVPVDAYAETIPGPTVSRGDFRAQTGKTNQAILIQTTSQTYNAESANKQQVNQDYGVRDGKNVTRAGTSKYFSGVTPSVQYKSRERSQTVTPKEMDSNIAGLVHRGSPTQSTTKAPRRRVNSSTSGVTSEVAKRPMNENLEMSRVGGYRRPGSVGEAQGTGGVDGISGAGGVGGAQGTGGVDETRRPGIGSRTHGSEGYRKVNGLRDMTYEAPVTTSTTGYSAVKSSVAWDSPTSEPYSKLSQNTYSSTSRNQDDYEASHRFGDSTFGLKEDVKTKNKYSASRLSISKSRTASENAKAGANANVGTSNGVISYGSSHADSGNGDSSSKQHDLSVAIDHTGYKGSDRGHTDQWKTQSVSSTDSGTRQSNSDATILTTASVYRDKLTHMSTNDEAVTSYGEKRITVKVPSTNKAAILEKWATASSSAIDTKPDLVEAKHPANGEEYSSYATSAKSPPSAKPSAVNNRQRIKNRVNAKPKNQGMTPDIVQSNVEISSNDASTAASWKKSSDNGLGGRNGTEYGHRYLEKITVAQATARNETLGSEVCVRAGLFRHPSDCQKFYECYWDRWIHQYTVHIFKCPVHLVYDDYITACNWPLDGPACVPHEAVKLYPQLPSAA